MDAWITWLSNPMLNLQTRPQFRQVNCASYRVVEILQPAFLFALFSCAARVMFFSPAKSALPISARQVTLSLASASHIPAIRPEDFISLLRLFDTRHLLEGRLSQNLYSMGRLLHTRRFLDSRHLMIIYSK